MIQGDFMTFFKPTVSIENFTKEVQFVFPSSFNGIKSSLNINKIVSISIENKNLKSNIGILYSTSNFLSSLFIDEYRNVIIKNLLVKNDMIARNIIIMNKVDPYIDIGLSLNKIINFNLNLIRNPNYILKSSFLFKKNDLHAGIEINHTNKYETAFLFRMDNNLGIFTSIIKYDFLNLAFYKKITDLFSLATEIMANDKSVFSRIGFVAESYCTTIKLELNTFLNVILLVEKKIYENVIVSICSEMKDYGVFDNGIALNLEI